MDGQSAGKTLIADPTICHRAAAAYPGRPEADRLFDVVVAQLPNGDYYVFAPGDFTSAGEFRCDAALLDAHFRLKAHLCG
jgi:hypothetical protein